MFSFEGGFDQEQEQVAILFQILRRRKDLHFDTRRGIPYTLPCSQIGIHVLFGSWFYYFHPFPSENRQFMKLFNDNGANMHTCR